MKSRRLSIFVDDLSSYKIDKYKNKKVPEGWWILDQHIKINSISLHQQSPTRIIKTKKIPLKIATEPINFLVVNQECTKPQWDIWNSHEGKNKWSE